MAGYKGVAEDLLSLTLEEIIKLKKHLEQKAGIQLLPTLDVRVVAQPKRNCGGGRSEEVLVIVNGRPGNIDLAIKMASELTTESAKHLTEIFTNGSGIFKNKIEKDEAESLKAALMVVGASVELK